MTPQRAARRSVRRPDAGLVPDHGKGRRGKMAIVTRDDCIHARSVGRCRNVPVVGVCGLHLWDVPLIVGDEGRREFVPEESHDTCNRVRPLALGVLVIVFAMCSSTSARMSTDQKTRHSGDPSIVRAASRKRSRGLSGIRVLESMSTRGIGTGDYGSDASSASSTSSRPAAMLRSRSSSSALACRASRSPLKVWRSPY